MSTSGQAMRGRERLGALFSVAMLALLLLGVAWAMVDCVRCQRTSATFAPFRTWWSAAGVLTMTEDVDALVDALAAGPDALVPACRRILAHATAALEVGPAPDDLLEQRHHDAATNLKAHAERCANGDFYAIRPMVSENGLGLVTQRYDEFVDAEADRRNGCSS